MKTLPAILLALTLVTAPLLTACWGCEGGPVWHPYAQDVAAATLDAGTAVLIPLTVAVSTRPTPDSLGVEVSITDCDAGSFSANARLLRADGTAITTHPSGLTTSTETGPVALTCPYQSVVFALAPSELTCTSERCTASLQVELTSATGAGPREVNLHLVNAAECGPTLRTDGVIDSWGQ